MQNLSCYNEFHLYENKNQFHINEFVLSLASKHWLEGTRKRPIFCGMRERVVVLFFYIYISFWNLRLDKLGKKRWNAIWLTLRANGRNNGVAKRLTGFKLCATTCNRLHKRTQHVTSNNVGSCWSTMLRPFALVFTLAQKRYEVNTSICSVFCRQ